MTVHRPLELVARDLDLRAEGQRMADALDVVAVGTEQGQGRAGPEEYAHRNTFRQLGQKRPQLHSYGVACQGEVRGDEPAGQVNVRPRLAKLRGESRQGLGAVDQHLERAAAAGRRVAGSPELAAGRFERSLPADPAQAAAVVRAHEPLEGVAEKLVECEERIGHRHTSCPCSPLRQPP